MSIAVAAWPARFAAQSANLADMPAKLSGHWKLNTELTPASSKPGRLVLTERFESMSMNSESKAVFDRQ